MISFDAAGKPAWKDFKGFPPVWVVSVDAYVDATGDVGFLRECLDALRKQIGWFESKRAVPGGGFYYLDVTTGPWESGMDERNSLRPAPSRRRREYRCKFSCVYAV